jgi:CRISPR-associated protein Cmr4
MNACLTFVHALSPLHAGTGQGVGVIDLPIAREKATNLPFLPGSTLKGTLRDECEGHAQHGAQCESVFGPKNIADDASAYSGSAIFTDQRLLCLPVRSLLGTFAWVTSPYILGRLKRDAENAGVTGLPNVPTLTAENCMVTGNSNLVHQQNTQRQVILEDLDLTVPDGDKANAWADWLKQKIFANNTAWQATFAERFCVVPDDILNFLAETATEVTARNRLNDDTKTVERGALWYEESLPTETILSGLLVAVKVKVNNVQEVFTTVETLTQKPLQLGGSATVGRGLCRMTLDYQAPAN